MTKLHSWLLTGPRANRRTHSTMPWMPPDRAMTPTAMNRNTTNSMIRKRKLSRMVFCQKVSVAKWITASPIDGRNTQAPQRQPISSAGMTRPEKIASTMARNAGSRLHSSG